MSFLVLILSILKHQFNLEVCLYFEIREIIIYYACSYIFNFIFVTEKYKFHILANIPS